MLFHLHLLTRVVFQLNNYLSQICGNVRMICDGPSHLRQCLHPDSVRRDCALSHHCNTFTDIRWQSVHFFYKPIVNSNDIKYKMTPDSPLYLEILKWSIVNNPTTCRKEFHIRYPNIDIRNNSLLTMAQHFGLDTDIRHGLGHCRAILEVAMKLLSQGIIQLIVT